MKPSGWFRNLVLGHGAAVAAMATALMSPTTADAVTFAYTYTGGGYTITGSLSADLIGTDLYHVMSGTINVTGTETGTGTLLAGGPSPFYSPSGAFIINNVLYNPASTSATGGSTPSFLDPYGLVFQTGSKEWNIWGNSPGGPNTYSLVGWTSASGYVPYFNTGTFSLSVSEDLLSVSSVSVSEVPLPPALLLFGSALAGVGLLGRRRRRQTSARTA